jgi:hypothetical protein
MYNTTAPRQTLPACMLVNDRGRDESLHTEICQRPLLMGRSPRSECMAWGEARWTAGGSFRNCWVEE